MQQQDNHEYPFLYQRQTCHQVQPNQATYQKRQKCQPATYLQDYFDSLTVNAGNGGFLHCIQMDTSVNAANQVVSVGADIAFDADPKFFACLVRFESSSVPTTLPTAYDVYPLDGRHDGGYYTVKDCVTIDVLPRTPGNN